MLIPLVVFYIYMFLSKVFCFVLMLTAFKYLIKHEIQFQTDLCKVVKVSKKSTFFLYTFLKEREEDIKSLALHLNILISQ